MLVRIDFFCRNRRNYLFLVFADARQKIEDPIGRYFTESNLYRVWSFMALPVTLPIDLTYAVTKRYENIFHSKSRFGNVNIDLFSFYYLSSLSIMSYDDVLSSNECTLISDLLYI